MVTVYHRADSFLVELPCHVCDQSLRLDDTWLAFSPEGERVPGVQQAVRTLEAAGKMASVRKVNRLLRLVPPYRGLRYSTLLPLLRNQQVTPTDPAYTSVVNMAVELEEAVAQRRDRDLSALIDRGERTWSQNAPAMFAASARGEAMEAWAAAFERLRRARDSAIVHHHGRRYVGENAQFVQAI
jgi:hypothetical protein